MRERIIDVVQSNAVVGRYAGDHFARRDQPPECRPALRLAVVMRAATPGEETEAGERGERTCDGVGQSLFKPADGAGAHAAQHHAVLPRGAQVDIEAPITPHSEHAARIAPADEYAVLLHDVRLQ